jgi:hypothetical protein
VKHQLEIAVAVTLTITSTWCAYRGNWSAATYFIALAALLDFDDWMRVG